MWKPILLVVLTNSFFLSLGVQSLRTSNLYDNNEDSDSEEDSEVNNFRENYKTNYKSNYLKKYQINSDEEDESYFFRRGRNIQSCLNNYPQRCPKGYPGDDCNDDAQCSDAIDKFNCGLRQAGIKLLKAYVDSCPSKPGAISPLGTLFLLSTLAIFGVGETKDEVYDLLNLSNQDEIECVFDRINYILYNLPSDVEFTRGSNIFANEENPLTDKFQDVLLNIIIAAGVTLDFSNNERAADIVNGQVKLETGGRVKNVVDSCIFNRSTELAAITGTYFSSPWDIEFELSKKVREFRVAPGVDVPGLFYTQTAIYDYAYISELKAQAIRIYYQNKLFDLVVILPDEPFTQNEVLNKMLEDPNGYHDKVYSQLKPTKVEVTIPAYNQKTLVDIRSLLKEGTDLETIYDAETIQLEDAIEDDKPAAISIGLQKNIIEIPPDGCPVKNCPEGNPVQFLANYPHFWFLHITCTDSLLYIGYTNGPTEKYR